MDQDDSCCYYRCDYLFVVKKNINVIPVGKLGVCHKA